MPRKFESEPTLIKRRYSEEEVGHRGRALYRAGIRRKVSGEKKGRVVAIDIDSEDFEVADDALMAAERLLARHPGADIWFERIGYRTFRRFGAWHAGEQAG